jgi:hypothetical protein
MAREIVTLCDPCLAEDTRSTGRSIEIAVDGKSRSVELCESHEAELLKPLLDVLGRFGQRVVLTAPAGSRTPRPAAPIDPDATRKGKPPAGPRDLTCLVCPATYGSASGLGLHYVAEHGAPKRATMSSVYGPRCPLCGHTGAPNGLGAHTGALHRTTVAQAFTEARDGGAGDPFGVVAERTALLRSA